MSKLEAARAELRAAAIVFAGWSEDDCDEDNYVNIIARLEVAAEKFTFEKVIARAKTNEILNEGIADTFIEMLKKKMALATTMQERAAISAALLEAEKYR